MLQRKKRKKHIEEELLKLEVTDEKFRKWAPMFSLGDEGEEGAEWKSKLYTTEQWRQHFTKDTQKRARKEMVTVPKAAAPAPAEGRRRAWNPPKVAPPHRTATHCQPTLLWAAALAAVSAASLSMSARFSEAGD